MTLEAKFYEMALAHFIKSEPPLVEDAAAFCEAIVTAYAAAAYGTHQLDGQDAP